MSAVGERASFSFTEYAESGGGARVRLAGEFDVAGAPAVQTLLRRLESEGSDVLLDLTELSFIDALGMHVIAEAAEAARQGGFGFAIAGPVSDAVRAAFMAAGAGHHLPGGQARLAAPVSEPEPRGKGESPAISATGRDHIASDSDQTSADRDQTASDEDQTSSDRDHAGSDDDQSAADRDQVAANRDQLSADRDQLTADRAQAASDERGQADEARYERSRRSAQSHDTWTRGDDRRASACRH